MIDIHNHLLPGLDDGAKSLEETIEIAKTAQEYNIYKIVATPHYIEENFKVDGKKIKENIKKSGGLHYKPSLFFLYLIS